MEILVILLVLVVVGVLLWLLNTYVPMDQKVKTIINVFIILVILVWLVVKFLMPLVREAGG